jgi:hypothetical protein
LVKRSCYAGVILIRVDFRFRGLHFKTMNSAPSYAAFSWPLWAVASGGSASLQGRGARHNLTRRCKVNRWCMKSPDGRGRLFCPGSRIAKEREIGCGWFVARFDSNHYACSLRTAALGACSELALNLHYRGFQS